ncbi:MAG: hypothetical protein HeimC2_39930 [Candidatus Heimdallarchaeota archaeon LC_2]|nr:MAG: hypothetical protein HeimC2_39930 [Candidatus Heimdallarchaeota archaeon LC_2]
MIGITSISGNSESKLTESGKSEFNLQISAEPAENVSQPFISVGPSSVQVGDKFTIFFGMKDEVDQTLPLFIPEYNYSIFITTGSIQFDAEELTKLSNYTLIHEGLTEDFLEEIEINTLNGGSSFKPGNYSTLFFVNSTNRGLLNATANFEIIVEPGANINVLFSDPLTGSTFENVNLQVNQTREIKIILINNGLSNAFNISLDSSNINEPVGLSNITLPVNIPVIPSFDRQEFNFSVTPNQYGIGEIQFILRYTDGLSNQKTNAPSLGLRTLPNIIGKFELEDSSNKIEYFENEDFNIIVNINYLDTFPLRDLSIKFGLTSSKINFLPTQVPFIPNISKYSFNGNAIQPGFWDVILTLTIFDSVGDDQVELILSVQTFELIELSGPLAAVQRTFSDILPILAIGLYFVFIAGLAILYFRADIRKRFFERVLGLQLIENVKYKSTSIVIDGSNIAWEQQSSEKKPMIANIKKAHQALKENGFKDIVIIADAALRYQIDDQAALDKMVVEKFIKLVPAKVNADGFILRFSAENGYLILSNDLYKEYRETYLWIDERRIPYTILNRKIYLHPTFE